MKRFSMIGMLVVAMAGVPALVGCDRTVREETVTRERRDGTTEVERERVTESPDGTRTRTETVERERDR